jgi:hypothetical protein
MHLEPGFALTVAPRFHLSGAWAGRLRVHSGVEARGEHLFPRCCCGQGAGNCSTTTGRKVRFEES